METFTLAGLTAKLRECAGETETADLDGDIHDVPFSALGYDSLALLNTVASIEREHGVGLDDDAVAKAETPRQLLDMINARAGLRT
ncbi:acyl carrier protein [Actinomadura harenae]|uniref:Acyl carrier protein n=1 Tax=Actinomadura harenae TaxID=2483351 RepID=A0A3M2M7S1_9ACTN|nr:acyl carrier protein [Actinomadura harenae]RMI43158.1 acyl carrier protein [Actinomadura harenae]